MYNIFTTWEQFKKNIINIFVKGNIITGYRRTPKILKPIFLLVNVESKIGLLLHRINDSNDFDEWEIIEIGL